MKILRKNKKKKNENIKIKQKWFKSYLLVICIPIFMSIAILVNMQIMVNDERTIQGRLRIDGIIHRIESEINTNKMLTENFKNVDVIRKMVEGSGDRRMLSEELSDVLNDFVVKNNITDEVAVFYPNVQLIINKDGVFTPFEYWKRTYKKSDIGYSDWKIFISGSYGNQYTMYPVNWMETDEKVAGQSFLHLNHLSKTFPYTYNELRMLIQSSSRVDYDKTMQNAYFAIYDEKGDNIYAIKNIDKKLLPLLREGNEEKIIYANGRSYIIEKAASDETGFVFVVMVERYNSLLDIKIIPYYILMIILISFLCIWWTWKISDRSYTFVDGILDRLGKYDTGSSTKNDISMINGLIDKIIEKNEENDKKIFKQRKQFMMLNIGRLLKGNVTSFEIFQMNLPPSERVRFLSESFAVMIVMLDNYDEFTETDDEIKEQDLIWFAVHNVADELFRNTGDKLYFVDTEEIPLFLISFGDDDRENSFKEMQSNAEELQSFMKKHLKIEITISLSNVHTGLEGIRYAYDEAMDTMSYRYVFENERVITPDSVIDSRDADHVYNQDYEVKLLNFIQSGNYDGAAALIDSLLSLKKGQNVGNIKKMQFLVYDIASTLMRKGEYIESALPASKDEFIDKLMSTRDLETMRDMLLDITKKLCEQKEQSGVDYLVNKVAEYVNENYFDSELSVANIAEHFHFHANYISSTFKQAAGMGLLEFINKTRIKKSIELLAETDYNITVISKSVGYTSANTYIRIGNL